MEGIYEEDIVLAVGIESLAFEESMVSMIEVGASIIHSVGFYLITIVVEPSELALESLMG